ncbi:hypothetical protein EF879_09630 [Micromonospora sp. HM5-17]|nr:hypothetical protein EF879_09630 [Micromonospora sp. HM5-17]
MGVAGGVISAGIGVLFLRAGLEDADRWAGVFGAFLNLAGLGVAIYSALWTRRAVTGSAPSIGGEVTNTIRGGRLAGPVVQARDVEQVNTGPAAAPDAATRTASAEPGSVSNRIEGGQFHNLVIQGRDVRGLHLPAAGQAGERLGTRKRSRC